MRKDFKKRIPHEWFAWHPVIVRRKIVWLCIVIRTWIPLGGGVADGFWSYDPKVAQSSDRE